MIYYKKNSFIKKIFLKISRSDFSIAPVFTFLKSVVFLFLSLIVLLYVSYLFFLPKFVNEERIEEVLNSYLSKNTKLTLDIDKLKVYPNYKFDINLRANTIKLKYSKNKDFLVVQNFCADINLLTLFFGYIDFNRIKTDKIIINTNFTKSKRYSCFDYFDLDIFKFNTSNSKFKLRNFRVLCDEFNLNLYDENIKKSFYINSKKVKFFLSEPSKPFSITTKGVIRSKNRKIVDFDLNLECILKKDALSLFKAFVAKLNYNPLLYADKYNFSANAVVKLKASPNGLNGSVNLSDYSFSVEGIDIPKNNILILFRGDKIISDCNFNLTKDRFIKVHFLKSKFLELKLNSSVINLAELKEIVDTLLRIFYPRFNTKDVDFSGLLSADLYIKSDFKTINSKGFLSIKNAKITHKPLKLSLTNINSDINFENNKINILNTSALVDRARFYLSGLIDDKMNLDLKVNSDSLDIAQIVNFIKTMPFSSYLDDYIFKGGILKLDAIIKGNIEKPLIETNTSLKNLKIFIKSYKVELVSSEIFVDKNFNLSASNSLLLTEYMTLKVPFAKAKLADNTVDIKADIVPYSKLVNIKNKNLNLRGKVFIDKNFIDAVLFEGNKKLISLNGLINDIKAVIEDKVSLSLPLYDNLSFDATGTLNITNAAIGGIFNLYNIIYKPFEIYIPQAYLEALSKGDNLSVQKFSADIFNGSINAKSEICLKNQKTKSEIILKEINVRHLSSRFKEFSIAASGKLSALINAEIIGCDINTLNSYIKFNIDNGELSQFAKLERFLQAGNILSQSILKLTLNSTISALTRQNTGDFKTIEGTIKVKNSMADVQYVKSLGSNMSLYITGKLNLLNQTGNFKILGRIPSSIVSVLGNVGKFSTGQLVDKMSKDTQDIINSITVSPFEKMMSCPIAQEDILNIPPLANQISGTTTREFIVRINGPITSTSSIKYFKWRARE